MGPGSDTLKDLLEQLKGLKRLAVKPSACQLARQYRKPVAVSPNGRVKAWPNGYASYHTQEGETVVWVDGCRRYSFGEDAYGKKPAPLTEDQLLSFPWYVAVALIGEDAVSENVMSRKGDRPGNRSEARGERDSLEQEEAERWKGGTRYETPECAVIRKEVIRQMLGRLSPRQREVTILSDKYGYSKAEVARLFTRRREEAGNPEPYSRACVSKLYNQARYRLNYRKVPF